MIFGSWSAEVPPLPQYLGNMRFYLDLYLGRTDAGTEVIGVPQVWNVAANWKFPTDNFTGDNFHLYSTHGSIVELGLVPPDPMSLSYGHLIRAEGGHVLHVYPERRIRASSTSGFPGTSFPIWSATSLPHS